MKKIFLIIVSYVEPIITYLLNIVTGIIIGLLGNDIFANSNQENWTLLNSNYFSTFVIWLLFNGLLVILYKKFKYKFIDNTVQTKHLFQDAVKYMYDNEIKTQEIDFDEKLERIEKLHTIQQTLYDK